MRRLRVAALARVNVKPAWTQAHAMAASCLDSITLSRIYEHE